MAVNVAVDHEVVVLLAPSVICPVEGSVEREAAKKRREEKKWLTLITRWNGKGRRAGCDK